MGSKSDKIKNIINDLPVTDKAYDVISFGETMVVFSPDSNGPLRYINNFTKSIGGAESNALIALSHLGHKTLWFSKLGNDEFGRYVKLAVGGEGVDVSKVKFDENLPTGLMFKEHFATENPSVYYYRKNSAASSISEDDISEEFIKEAKILHITGITPALSESARKAVFKAIKIAKENNVIVSFDPNIRKKLWSIDEAKEVLLEIMKSSDIVFPGLDEGQILLDESTPEAIADKLFSFGCSIAVVKLGSKGCYIADKEREYFAEGFKPHALIDTVGAGDGFAAGVLSGLLRGSGLFEAARLGNGVGAMATLVKGDMQGYPYYDQLMQFMGKSAAIER